MQRFCFRLGTVSGALATIGLLPGAALATYSIAATDSQTQEVGGAITSCVGSLDVGIVYGSLPGVGVIHAQAQLDQRGRAKMRAIELLEQGVDPAEIIVEITRRELDQSFASRQYGIVDLSGRSAGFTGEEAQAYKNDQQGKIGTFTYTVQGNILTSQAVLDQTSEAFQEPACDLAERLMRALEAGADNGEGDSRCTGAGIPADSAFIRVDRPGQSEPHLQLSIAGTRPDNPLPQLREMFEAWRTTHPCPMAGAAGSGSAGAGAGAAGAGAAGSGTAGAAGMVAGAAGVGAGGASGIGGATGSGPAGGAPAAAGMSALAGASAVAGTRASGTSGSTAAAAPGASGAAGLGANTSGTRSGAGATAPPAAGRSGTATSAISEQPAAQSGSGCALTPRAAANRPGWLLTVTALWFVQRLRRRRSQLRRAH